MSTVNQKLIDEQTKLIQDIDVAKEMDKFLTRTLFLEKIRKHQEEEYNKGVKLLEEEKSQLSTLEKFKRRKEFEEKMEELRREKFKLETTMYENILKEQFNKIDKKSKLIENVTTDLKQQAYREDFNEVLKKAFPEVYKELKTDLSSLNKNHGFDSRQSLLYLMQETTGKKDLAKELDELYKENSLKKIKDDAIKNSLSALKITSGLMNPAGFIIRSITTKVADIPVMKKVLDNINEKFDESLDILGVSEKHKKYIKIAGGVVASALVIGVTGSLLLPHEMLNADELLSGLDSVKDKATETLSNINVSDKMEHVKTMMQSTNSADGVNIVKDAVSNVEIPKTEFTDGLKEHLNIKAEPTAFTSSDLLVNQPEVKLPETYDDTKPQNFVMDPEKAAALKQVTLTGEVPEILKQDGTSVNVVTTDLNDSKVATQQDILNDLENNNSKGNIEITSTTGMVEHKVVAGEHLRQIIERVDSAEYDLKGAKLNAVVNLIAEQNGIADPNKIFPDQIIKIPENPEALKAFCETHKDRLSELMNQQFVSPTSNVAANIELPAHTTPVSASPNGFTQLAPEIEMPETVPVVEVPKEMLAQNSRLIASNILEGMPKEELEKFMSKVRTDENQLLDILSSNIEKQIMADPQGQFDANKIVIDFNQNKEALEREFGRSISDSMVRRMGGSLEIQPDQIMKAYTSVENELRATLAPVTQVTNPTIELPQQPLSNGMVTPEGKLEITTEKIDGKEVVVHRTIRP